MNNQEEKLFDFIKKKIPKNVSFIDEIAATLNISYDAAYRRLNGKTSLSFNEAIELTKHYQIPISNLYNLSSNGSFSTIKNSYNNTFSGVEEYFNDLKNTLDSLQQQQNSTLFFSAKDIPLYYAPDDSLFEKFKLNVFLNFLSNENLSTYIPLSAYSISKNLKQGFSQFKSSFKKNNIVEIWNKVTVDSTLNQLFYFFKIKLVTKNEILQLCDELIHIVKHIEKQAQKGYLKNEKLTYNLYHNDLVNLNNTLYLKSDEYNALILTYTFLSQIKIEEKKSCIETEKHFKTQLQFSKHLSGSAEVNRKIFFTSIYDKIHQLKKQLGLNNYISFL